MKTIATIMTTILIAIAAFGPFIMAYGHEHGQCAASTMNGIACPMVLTAFDFIEFHAKALAELSTAVFSFVGILNILMAIFIIAIVFMGLRAIKTLEHEHVFQKLFLYAWLKKHFEKFFLASQLNLLNWSAVKTKLY